LRRANIDGLMSFIVFVSNIDGGLLLVNHDRISDRRPFHCRQPGISPMGLTYRG
jgi:hypothetical protein